MWELGSGLGHIDRLLVLARNLRFRGHEISLLLRDTSRAHPRVAAEGFPMGQAPVWLHPLARPLDHANYTSVLASAGWMDAVGLAGLIASWRHAYDCIRPDLVLCDHAPTAALAARQYLKKVWRVGSSFEVPPSHGHFTAMAYWDAAARTRCAADDASLLTHVNAACALIGDPPLTNLPSLFDDTKAAIASIPELAHYDGHDANTPFCGPFFLSDKGRPANWPHGDGARVLVYLEPKHSEFTALMSALAGLPVRALVYAKGLSTEAAARLAGPRIQFENEPVHMADALAQARLVISHGGQGTVTATALAGRPQLVINRHMEQVMTGRRVSQLGIGLAVKPGDRPDWAALVRRLLDDVHFTNSAQALASRYAGQTAETTAAHIADLIEADLRS